FRQAPPQPVKTWPAPGAAVRRTLVPGVNGALQAPVAAPAPAASAQSIAAGTLVTRPLPAPPRATVIVGRGTGSKRATTDAACDTVTWHGPAPLHAPVQ